MNQIKENYTMASSDCISRQESDVERKPNTDVEIVFDSRDTCFSNAVLATDDEPNQVDKLRS